MTKDDTISQLKYTTQRANCALNVYSIIKVKMAVIEGGGGTKEAMMNRDTVVCYCKVTAVFKNVINYRFVDRPQMFYITKEHDR